MCLMTTSLRPPTRDAIVEAAFDVLSRDPSAALADVAARAGVGRATLHRHFAKREDLIRALALIAIEEMDAAAEAACTGAPSYEDAFRRMVTVLIPLGDRHGFLAREPVEDDPAIAAEFQRQTDETKAMVEGAKREGLFDPAVPDGLDRPSLRLFALRRLGKRQVRRGNPWPGRGPRLAHPDTWPGYGRR